MKPDIRRRTDAIFRSPSRERLEEQADVRKAAREQALLAFHDAKVAYHGSLKARRRGDCERVTVQGQALNAAESRCEELGLDPWSPESEAAVRRLRARR